MFAADERLFVVALPFLAVTGSSFTGASDFFDVLGLARTSALGAGFGLDSEAAAGLALDLEKYSLVVIAVPSSAFSLLRS